MGSRGLLATYQRCLSVCLPGDALLLLGRHVWLLNDVGLRLDGPGIKYYALDISVAEAGLSGSVPESVQVVNWSQVLELLQQRYPLQQTWV